MKSTRLWSISLLSIPLLSPARELTPVEAQQEWDTICATETAGQPTELARRAAACELSGQLDEARRHYTAALQLAIQRFGEDDPRTQTYSLRLQLLGTPPRHG